MNILDFLGFNVVIVSVVLLIVFVYLIFLIKKRRKDEFLHSQSKKE